MVFFKYEAQAAQHETGNFFNQHWIVTLCLRDVLWIYLKKKNFILVIREFLIFQSNKKIDELKMVQAAQHETGNFFDQYWIVTLCLRDVLWIYLKKKNFMLVILEFLFCVISEL